MDKIQELLGDELWAQVKVKLGSTKVIVDDGSFIPKSRFDEVNNTAKDLKAQLAERDKQLTDLKPVAEGNEQLTKQLADLTAANAKAAADYEAKLVLTKRDFAIASAIAKVQGKNPRAIKALLDMELVKLEGETIRGLDEQFTNLKKSDPYLFGDTKPPQNHGANPPLGETKTKRQEYDAAYAAAQKNPNDQALRMALFRAKELLKE